MDKTDLVGLLAAIIGGTAVIIGALIGKANKKRTIAFCIGGFFIVCAACLFIAGRLELPPPSPTPEPASVDSPDPPIETAVVTPTKAPSKEDLDIINSKIHYPENSEYLPEYKTQYIRAPGGDSVYAFSSHRKDKTLLYTVDEGEKVTVLAENKNNGFSCVIIDSIEKAAWVNTDYLVDTPA